MSIYTKQESSPQKVADVDAARNEVTKGPWPCARPRPSRVAALAMGTIACASGAAIAEESLPWMRTFSHPVIGVYKTGATGSAASEIVVATLDPRRATLHSYATGRALARGCLSAGDERRCGTPAQAHVETAAVESGCDSFDRPAVRFLSTGATVCLYDLRATPRSSSNVPELYEVVPTWDGRREDPNSALAIYFQSAPYWQPAREPRENARYCNHYPTAVAAIDTNGPGDREKPISGDLNDVRLRWASPFLVHVKAGFRCVDVLYKVDYLTHPVGYLDEEQPC